MFFQPRRSMMLAPSMSSSMSSTPKAMCMNPGLLPGATGSLQFTQKDTVVLICAIRPREDANTA